MLISVNIEAAAVECIDYKWVAGAHDFGFLLRSMMLQTNETISSWFIELWSARKACCSRVW